MDLKDLQSLVNEFESYGQNKVNDGILTIENKDEWHFYLFNENYYIIGYYQCSEWLKSHDIDPSEAVGACIQYEKDNFDEVSKNYDNSVVTVNMLAYILGEQWLYNEGGEDFINDLLEEEEEEDEDE